MRIALREPSMMHNGEKIGDLDKHVATSDVLACFASLWRSATRESSPTWWNQGLEVPGQLSKKQQKQRENQASKAASVQGAV
jgi:hypothetical protein